MYLKVDKTFAKEIKGVEVDKFPRDLSTCDTNIRK
jgi:hypothetical protein